MAERAEAGADCSHHWIIESPKGPTSRGVCKHCGAEKEFLNWCEGFFREDDVSTLDEARSARSVSFDRRDD